MKKPTSSPLVARPFDLHIPYVGGKGVGREFLNGTVDCVIKFSKYFTSPIHNLPKITCRVPG